MYDVIVGCGRVGSLVATILSEKGHNVVMVDAEESRFKKLGSQFTGQTVTGDGTDINTLKEAGINKADVLILATNDDNSNLMSAQIAKKIFGVKRVFVRMKDPNKLSVYKEYSLETVSATMLAAHKIADSLMTTPEIEIIGGIFDGKGKIVRFQIDSDQQCRTLKKMVSAGAVRIVALEGNGKIDLSVKDEALAPGATVVGAMITENLKKLNKLFAVEDKP